MLICPQTIMFVAQTPEPMNTPTSPNLTIRKATLAGLPSIMPIYDKAREMIIEVLGLEEGDDPVHGLDPDKVAKEFAGKHEACNSPDVGS